MVDVWFRLLGPVTVEVDGAAVAIDRAQRRAVLAYLLLNAGRMVSAEQLIDALWGESPPATARTQIHAAVSVIRRTLRVAGHDPITSERGTYRLNASAENLDLALFNAEFDSARTAANPEVAAKHLRIALDQWHGSPLWGISAAYVEIARTRLWEDYVAAQEMLADAELAMGRHLELIPHLASFSETNPLREGLTARLMLALYRAGRQADALAVYRRTRSLLVADLGVEPGPELQALHRDILANDPLLLAPRSRPGAGNNVPRLLPYDIADFTGRGGELDWLDRVAAEPTTTAIISTVAGTAGIGKTALAVRWAYHASERFPDGQLYLNLRGHGPGEPLSQMSALTRLLRAIDIADNAIPQDEEEASALYRSTLAGRRVLVLLDNAATAEQVRPLLPSGKGNLALITSRDRLGGLIARDGAQRLTLGLLTDSDARDLIRRIIGQSRVDAEPEAVAALVDICGRLPLALRIAAANLDDETDRSIDSYVAGLRDGPRLPALAVDGDPHGAVLSVFNYSYQALSRPEQSLFRLLGLLPGADFTTPALAALAGISPTDTQSVLNRLVDGHLVVEADDDRYTMHDLVREYAAHLADAYDRDDDRAAALRRLFAWQLGHVEASIKLLFPTVLMLDRQGTPASLPGPAEALAWMDRERANLVASISCAARLPRPDMSWLLLSAMRPYLQRVRATLEMRRLAQALLPVAASQARAQAMLHLTIADSCIQNRYEEAVVNGLRCRDLAQDAGWTDAQVAALNAAGTANALLGRLDLAAELLTTAAKLLDADDATYRRSPTLNRLGMVHGLLGNLDAAVDYMIQSVHHTRAEHGGELALTTPLSFLAINRRLQGRHDLALAAVQESLDLIDGLQATHSEALIRLQLAKILRDTGDLPRALSETLQTLEVIEPSTDITSRVDAHVTHASILAENGQDGPAKASLDKALGLARAAHNDHNIVEALITLAAIHLRCDEPREALAAANEALNISTHKGFRLLQGQALDVLAAIEGRIGEPAMGTRLSRQAQQLYHDTGHHPAPNPVSWIPSLSWP